MLKKITALSVHLLTAAGALLAFWSLILIVQGELQTSLIVLALAALIDCVDGTLARRANVSTYTSYIDGALLDNIVDYLTWVFLPVAWAYYFLELPFLIGSIVLISSLFGFSHYQAKTDDHFFRGFPSYWNLVVLYLYVLGAGVFTSSVIMLLFSILVLTPIKLIYPSRTKKWQKVTLTLFVPYGIILGIMLMHLDQTPLLLTLASFYFPVYYVTLSTILTSNNPVLIQLLNK